MRSSKTLKEQEEKTNKIKTHLFGVYVLCVVTSLYKLQTLQWNIVIVNIMIVDQTVYDC
jgi:hypothetical protein